MNKLTLAIIVLVLAAIGGFFALEYFDTSDTLTDTSTNTAAKHRTAVLTTNYGDIILELFTEEMPATTGNFITLAESGFYNGVLFHRVIPNFMVQAGDPLTKDDTQESRWGTGGPGYTIADEFVRGLSNVRGTIAMANTGVPDSGGSQFFINVADNIGLDFDKEPFASKHPVFGMVVEGMEVIDVIATVSTEAENRPLEPVVIMSIDIE